MKNIKSISLLTILIVSLASPIQAQSSLKYPILSLTAGSAFDLISTLHVLGPNVKEGNPILSNGGRIGLSVTKIGITSAVIIGLKSISRKHSKLATVIGYIGSGVFTSIAIHNLSISR